mmetsp:Transcript_29280/g.44286  ORF Transcript_29280/g.44286 Transcript_29280/m.44286 type:complete len:86 (-) Transcript_29280:760-1017(-)
MFSALLLLSQVHDGLRFSGNDGRLCVIPFRVTNAETVFTLVDVHDERSNTHTTIVAVVDALGAAAAVATLLLLLSVRSVVDIIRV